MTHTRIAVVAGLALLVAGGIWLAVSDSVFGAVAPDPAPSAAAPAAEPTAVGAREAVDVAAEPGVVRILARPVEAAAAEQEHDPEAESAPADAVIGEYEHLGPLSPEAVASYRESLAMQRDKILAHLGRTEVDASDSAALLREAGQLLSAYRMGASVEALAAGSYVVTESDGERPQPIVGSVDVAWIPLTYEGRSATLSIILPLSRHPRLADARSYYLAMREFDNSERARRFNELPDEQRLPLAEKILSILRDPDASSA
ncbi:MAG TPA: hypothetical protein ENI87_00475, partial [bacterium]|nr:hypothetical protein [bacterium]